MSTCIRTPRECRYSIYYDDNTRPTIMPHQQLLC